MAHNIMNNKKFYGLRKPAWHGLGHVSTDDMSVLEVADLIGIPQVFTRKVWFEGADGRKYDIPDRRVIVSHTPENGAVGHAVVSNRYRVVTHDDIIRIAHNVFEAKPVETLGVLGQGETLFLTYTLPTINVNGDEVNTFLMVTNPLDGKTTIRARVVETRVVCQNTLNISLGEKTDFEIAVEHRSDPKGALFDWLVETVDKTTEAVQAVRDACEILAQSTFTDEELRPRIELLYPFPAPDKKGQIDVSVRQNIMQRRYDVMTVLDKSHTIRDDQRRSDWGLFNAVVEYEDFARTKSTDMSKTFGSGAKRKQEAFATLTSVATS